MNLRLLRMSLLLVPVALGIAVWATSGAMPETVASHFNADGTANGFSARSSYTTSMLLLVVIVPTLVGLLPGFLARVASSFLNIPNREYWLAPDRRERTLEFLSVHGAIFAVLLASFLAYMHWLVVQANLVIPAALPLSRAVPSLVAFGLATCLWIAALFIRFCRGA